MSDFMLGSVTNTLMSCLAPSERQDDDQSTSGQNMILSMPVQQCSSMQQHCSKREREQQDTWRIRSTEADMLSGISQERNARSRGHWFTEFCNSQRLSHFAAPFIGARAKISVAENCAFLLLNSQSGYNEYCQE